MNALNIAIDGPVAAGKSTVAKLVAQKLGYRYIDTGAMYRCIALLVNRAHLDGTVASEVDQVLANPRIELKGEEVFLNGENVTSAIRTMDISRLVSVISVHPNVRQKLLSMQREYAREKGIVMEGRDIGSVVLPEAELKIFQVASVASRARRRYLELTAKGINCNYDELVKDIEIRDGRDSSREHAPLKQAPGAIVLDTSDLSAEAAAEIIANLARAKIQNG